MGHDADSVRAELAAAFARRERPSDDRIALSRPDCPGYEGDEAREWLRGKNWQDLLAEGIGVEHRDHVHFLLPEGWLYFFPAFAIIGLDIRHPAEMDETLLVLLGAFPDEMAAQLSRRERRAILHFLEYLSEAYERRGDLVNAAQRTLDSYWNRFVDEEPAGGDAPATAHQENGDVLS